VSRVLDKIITESFYYFWNATETRQVYMMVCLKFWVAYYLQIYTLCG
jgi:hypothetical protein